MRRIPFTLVVVFLAVSAVIAQTQETASILPTIPAASRSQADCTGFIANPSVHRDVFVVGGADDDFHSVVRQFVRGDSIYISSHKRGDLSVGNEYRVVRPANELFLTMHYPHERWDIKKLGKPYEDIGTVKITHKSKFGTVAAVTSSCESIIPGDTLVIFQPRDIPKYTISKPLDHFTPQDKAKEHGRVIASHNNFGYLGNETVVYLNLGERAGTLPGQRFKIYKIAPPRKAGFLTHRRPPPETVGEVVVLSVQAKSCAAMVVSSYREISAGDYVEEE